MKITKQVKDTIERFLKRKQEERKASKRKGGTPSFPTFIPIKGG